MAIDDVISKKRPAHSGAALEEAGDSDGSEQNSLNEPASERPKFDPHKFVREAPGWYSEGWWKAPGDPNNNFEVLLNPLLDREDKQCTGWKEEVQNLLILAGLFSAIVTAFIIESYQLLQPDPNDQIILLLSRIADQMSTSNGSISSQSLPPLGPNFTPSPTNVRINIYWFISLVLSLTVALIGIVTLQWLREYQRYDAGIQSMDWFGIFNARAHGLQRWYVPQIFTGLPLLLQAALVLFFVGLVEFLFAINIEVAVLVSVSIAIPIIFLIATTILPTLQLYTLHLPYLLRVNDDTPAPCPYKSPQALIFQRAAVASTALFNLCTWVSGALWLPFVVVIRLFARNGESFYTKCAPFSKTEDHYEYSCDRLRNAAKNWMEMDIQWPAARTSYSMSIQTPHTFMTLPSQSIRNDKFTNVFGFYDCITAMKNIVANSNALNSKERNSLWGALGDINWRICPPWLEALRLRASSEDPELDKALQGQVTALLRVIGPCGQQQTEKFVEQSGGDIDFIFRALVSIFFDQALGSELNVQHPFFDFRAHRQLIVAQEYLSHNAEEVFQCSNLPGITPPLSLSTRRSFLRDRVAVAQRNFAWMSDMSRNWTNILKYVILDTKNTVPRQPFARRCNGSLSARCGSNLHTESIAELTEYILVFQVPNDIRETLRLLHDLLNSKLNPVQDRPLALLTACAYINAVANVNEDDVDEFRALLDKICDLCDSLDPTLEARPGGTGRHWPKMEEAFAYIRNNCISGGNGSTRAVSQSSDLPHSPGVYEKVRRQFIRGRKLTRTQAPV